MSSPRALRALVVLLPLLSAACASTPHDYGAFLDHMPRSILVLPPLDETPEVDASHGWLATITRPLAEQGYYVFPVALVQRMLIENGLPTPYEMHQVPLDKLEQVFGADAVLYVTLTDWGSEYVVLRSITTVAYQARLVDIASGATLWQGSGHAARNSGDGGGGLIGALVAAVVTQVATSVSDPSPDVARDAHQRAFRNGSNGLLIGPHAPGFEEDQRQRREARAAGDGAAPRT